MKHLNVKIFEVLYRYNFQNGYDWRIKWVLDYIERIKQIKAFTKTLSAPFERLFKKLTREDSREILEMTKCLRGMKIILRNWRLFRLNGSNLLVVLRARFVSLLIHYERMLQKYRFQYFIRSASLFSMAIF